MSECFVIYYTIFPSICISGSQLPFVIGPIPTRTKQELGRKKTQNPPPKILSRFLRTLIQNYSCFYELNLRVKHVKKSWKLRLNNPIFSNSLFLASWNRSTCHSSPTPQELHGNTNPELIFFMLKSEDEILRARSMIFRVPAKFLVGR